MPVNSEHRFGFFWQNFAAFMCRPLEPDLTLIKESMALTDIWASNQVPSARLRSLAITQEQQRTCSFTSKYKVCGFKGSPWRGRGECTHFYKEQISSCGWLSAVALKSTFCPLVSDRQMWCEVIWCRPAGCHGSVWEVCSLLPQPLLQPLLTHPTEPVPPLIQQQTAHISHPVSNFTTAPLNPHFCTPKPTFYCHGITTAL